MRTMPLSLIFLSVPVYLMVNGGSGLLSDGVVLAAEERDC